MVRVAIGGLGQVVRVRLGLGLVFDPGLKYKVTYLVIILDSSVNHLSYILGGCTSEASIITETTLT